MLTLIFDCDGVLADTERDGHLPAFNQMFSEFGLPLQWGEEEYGKKLQIGGGKERLQSLLTPEFVTAAGLPRDAERQRDLIEHWHRRKTEIYVEMVARGSIPGRSGVRRVIEAAHEAKWQLAVASTSAQSSVRSVLQHVVGPEIAIDVSVFAGDIVPHKKPAPDIYTLAINQLGADPRQALVIEDSRNGLVAGMAAGLPVLITINDYTANDDFTGAAMVVTGLGEPGGESTVVIQNSTRAQPEGFLELSDLRACMSNHVAPANNEKGD